MTANDSDPLSRSPTLTIQTAEMPHAQAAAYERGTRFWAVIMSAICGWSLTQFELSMFVYLYPVCEKILTRIPHD
jgi:hypothetical protein